jgi:hypothetical protein
VSHKAVQLLTRFAEAKTEAQRGEHLSVSARLTEQSELRHKPVCACLEQRYNCLGHSRQV